MENSFIGNLRAQKWYNADPPRNLSGYLNDKSNRLIGWAIMRQLRVKSELCVKTDFIDSSCLPDYNLLNEDKLSYQPGWTNVTATNQISSFVKKSFVYQSNESMDTYIYRGNHGTYGKGGYVYEFRGSLSSLQTNLSQLHENQWIDNRTRAVIIQLTLYNPNVQLFTSVTFLAEFLSSSGVYPSSRFEPISFQSNISLDFSSLRRSFVFFQFFHQYFN